MSSLSIDKNSENLYENEDTNKSIRVDINEDVNKESIPIVTIHDIFGLTNSSNIHNNDDNDDNDDIISDIINDHVQDNNSINNELNDMNIRINNLETMVFGKKYLLRPPKLRRTIGGQLVDNNYVKQNIYSNNKNENLELDDLIERINKLEEVLTIKKKITNCKEKIGELEKIANEIVN